MGHPEDLQVASAVPTPLIKSGVNKGRTGGLTKSPLLSRPSASS